MEELTQEDCKAFFENRHGLYQLLSTLYRKEVTEDLLTLLAHTPLPQSNGDDDEAVGYRGLLTFLRERDEDTIVRLRGEYTNLILGGGVADFNLMASPYESAYTSDDHVLMQESRDQVVAFYYREHLDVDKSGHEPEDHIGFELEFVSILLQRASEHLENDDMEEVTRIIEVLQHFYLEHLCVWVPAFCNKLIKLDRNGFYKAIAHITKGLISKEPAYLDALAQTFGSTLRISEAAATAAAEVTAAVGAESDEGEKTDYELTYEGKLVEAEELFEHMAFLRVPFFKTLEYAQTPCTADDLEEHIEEFIKYKKSGYGAKEIRLMLADAYCLERVESSADEAEDADTDAGDAAAEDAITDPDSGQVIEDESEGEQQAEAKIPDSASEEYDDEEIVFVTADEDPDASRFQTRWQTSEVGKEMLSRQEPASERIKKLLATDADILQGYGKVFEAIQNGKNSFPEIESIIKETALYQEDNKHASMFLKRLEDAGALEWQGKWTLTSTGEEMLGNAFSTK